MLVFKKSRFPLYKWAWLLKSLAEWLTNLFYWGIEHLKESTWRSVTSTRNRLLMHLNNYWWAGISNYVYGSILVITKIYIFLPNFPSVSLLIMQSQPAVIAWAVTSTAAFYHCWGYTDHSVLWFRCAVCIWC